MPHIAAGSDFCDSTDANQFWDIITTACKQLFVWKKLYHVSQTMLLSVIWSGSLPEVFAPCSVWAFEVLLLAAGLALPPSCPTICPSATPAQAERGSTPDWPSGAVRVLSNSPARGGQRSICSEKLRWLETTPDDCFWNCFHIENNVWMTFCCSLKLLRVVTGEYFSYTLLWNILHIVKH